MSSQPDDRVVPHPALAADHPEETETPQPAAPPPPPVTRSRRGLIIAAVVALALTIGGYEAITHYGKVSTDNAQVDGHVVVVAPRVGGMVSAIRVVEGQVVPKGYVLATLDDSDLQVKVRSAQADLDVAVANLDAAEAQLDALTTTTGANKDSASAGVRGARAGVSTARSSVAQARAGLDAAKARASQTRADAERAASLFQSGAITKQAYDNALTADDTAQAQLAQAEASLSSAEEGVVVATGRLDQAEASETQAGTGDAQVAAALAQVRAARARVDQNQAALDGAKLQLSYAEIKAPFDGVIAKRNAEVGQMVQPGTGMVGLVGTDEVWITANFKETQIEGMAPGQEVDVEVDGSSEEFVGRVVAVAPATGGRFALMPADNSAGNFTKVVQRVPVRIALPPEAAQIVHPGESAEVTVHIR